MDKVEEDTARLRSSGSHQIRFDCASSRGYRSGERRTYHKQRVPFSARLRLIFSASFALPPLSLDLPVRQCPLDPPSPSLSGSSEPSRYFGTLNMALCVYNRGYVCCYRCLASDRYLRIDVSLRRTIVPQIYDRGWRRCAPSREERKSENVKRKDEFKNEKI